MGECVFARGKLLPLLLCAELFRLPSPSNDGKLVTMSGCLLREIVCASGWVWLIDGGQGGNISGFRLLNFPAIFLLEFIYWTTGCCETTS